VAKIGIVGSTGYTGVELLRLLVGHPEAEITVVTSRSESGRQVADLFQNLRGHVSLKFVEPQVEQLAECDLVFYATPNTVAMRQVPELLAKNVRVVDLSADFRIKDETVWSKWYGAQHACPELLDAAVYGLPEMNRADIKKAQLVANPGCYPTAIQLGFLPLLHHQLVKENSLIADAKSGVSGAGRKAAMGSLLAEASENFKAYGVAGHRHLPEIVQGLNQVARSNVDLLFVPHLTPMIRGIHATLYATLTSLEVELQSLFEDFYKHEPFVDVMPEGSLPETRSVRNSNYCRLAIHRPQDGNRVVVLAVEDNLVKGAAGQAIQNMNLMLGFPETMGLTGIAVLP